MTKTQALARLDQLRKAIEESPAKQILDASPDRCCEATGGRWPAIQTSWDEFTRLFSRAKSRCSDGWQYLEAEVGGVIWHACRDLELPESQPHEVDVRELAKV